MMVVRVPVAAQAVSWDASAVIGRIVVAAAGGIAATGAPAFHAIGGSVQFVAVAFAVAVLLVVVVVSGKAVVDAASNRWRWSQEG